MPSGVRVLLCGMCLAVAAGGSAGQGPPAPQDLPALRAARADALGKLARRLRELRIGSETTVQDLLAGSEEISAEVSGILLAASQAGEPKFADDGSCGLTMTLALADVIGQLKQIHGRHYKGQKITAEDFDRMAGRNKTKVLSETGGGAAEAEAEDEAVAVTSGNVESADHLTGPAKKYWSSHCTPEGRRLAVRAARDAAMRNLTERIGDVQIDSETTVREFVGESDFVAVARRSFLRGAREKTIRYQRHAAIVEVTVEVALTDVYMSVRSWAKAQGEGDATKLTKLAELVVEAEERAMAESGTGAPPGRQLKDLGAQEVAVLSVDWRDGLLRATGAAAIDADDKNTDRAKQAALGAAELDAKRKLAEKVGSLNVTAETSVLEVITKPGEIDADIAACIAGARMVEEAGKVNDDGTVAVTMEIELGPLWELMLARSRQSTP